MTYKLAIDLRSERALCLTVFLLLMLVSLQPTSAADKMNVLMIAVDDMRPDLGCYGAAHAKTPNIDRLAGRGIVFERAYCMQAVCSPSRTAVLTSLRPDVTKVWDLETHFRVAQPNCITLPQHFRANGYHTVGLGKIEHRGFEDGPSWSEPRWFSSGQSVSVDSEDWTKRKTINFSGVKGEFAQPLSQAEAKDNSSNGKAKAGPAFEVSPKADDDLPDGATAAEAVKRLATLKAQGQPFFLAVGFLKPHLPFVAPKKYWDMHDPNKIPLPAIDTLPAGTEEFVGHVNGELHNYPGVPQGNPIPQDFAKQLRHGYHACISYTDAQVGRLLTALDEQGLADNTVVVLWGDHGWQLGDHGLWHKHTNFELATRAPLIVSVPNGKNAGRKCLAPVEFVDIYPTLAEVCGLPAVMGLAGQSLRPYLENPDAPMQKPAISQYPRSSKEHGALMGYSIRTERYRCTFWRKRNGDEICHTELYDEQNDPAETVNLAEKAEHVELIAAMKKYLPPVGSDSQSKDAATKKKSSKNVNSSTEESREQRFERLYPGKAQLTLEEYLAKQGDPNAARQRFNKMDRNQDGIVTKAEFVGF